MQTEYFIKTFGYTEKTRNDQKGAQDIVVKVTKKVSSKFGETFGRIWCPK